LFGEGSVKSAEAEVHQSTSLTHDARSASVNAICEYDSDCFLGITVHQSANTAQVIQVAHTGPEAWLISEDKMSSVEANGY